MKKIHKIAFAFLAIALMTFAIISCKKQKCAGGHDNNNCICTQEYAPVCGSDNKTYGNACEAECNGIKNYTPGECSATP